MSRKTLILFTVAIVLLSSAGCDGGAPTPTTPPTVAPAPTATAPPTSTAIPTAPSPPTVTPRPTDAPTHTPTPTPQPTDAPASTATPALTTQQRALELAGRVSADRLMSDVRWLADDARRGRLTGSPEEDAVGAWLVQRFQDLGLQPFAAAGLNDYVQPFTSPAVTRYGRVAPGDTAQGENVIAVWPGTTRPDSYVCIGAHYDHIGTRDGQVYNGADDDATGVAAVLEAARILRAAGVQPQETLVFVCFSGEEIGLFGSNALCDRLATAGLTNRTLLLNMEVLGARQGAGTYLDVWDEDVPSTEPLVSTVQAAGQQLGVRVERRDRDPGSDAVALVECGVPAVSLDVAWSFENHPHYHRPTDDPEHIDVDGFRNAVRVAVYTLWQLANDGR